MAQRYTDPVALERMREGNCPECGDSPDKHLDHPGCSLTVHDALTRVMQYTLDQPTWPPS